MTSEVIFSKFQEMFPNWIGDVIGYQKIGSCTIVLIFKNQGPKIFLWKGDENWSFGTKLWRKRPENLEK